VVRRGHDSICRTRGVSISKRYRSTGLRKRCQIETFSFYLGSKSAETRAERWTNGAVWPLHAEHFEKGNGILRHFDVLFDEVVFHAARLCGRKALLPVDAAFSHGDNGLRFRIPILQMHRVEASGILEEILGGVKAVSNRRHLKL